VNIVESLQINILRSVQGTKVKSFIPYVNVCNKDLPDLEAQIGDTVTNEHDLENRYTYKTIYFNWHDHVRTILIEYYKTFFLYLIATFSVLWGLVEAANFFLKQLDFSNHLVLFVCIFISIVVGLTRIVHDYLVAVPDGLDKESAEIKNIARKQTVFWEYKLAYALLKSRIERLDQRMDDVLHNRIYVPLTRSMNDREYSKWLQTRPENTIRMVKTVNQLFIFDLVASLNRDKSEKIDLKEVVRIVGLMADVYKEALDFQTASKEINVPEKFSRIHEIQSQWGSEIQKTFRQILGFLDSVADLKKSNDKSSLNISIVYEAPPNIEEFVRLMKKLSSLQIG
jgi:hypothetical protein